MHRWSRMGRGLEEGELIDWCMNCGLLRYVDKKTLRVLWYCFPEDWALPPDRDQREPSCTAEVTREVEERLWPTQC